MIIGNNSEFFIQYDIIDNTLDSNLKLGLFNFWINGKSFPGRGVNLTINSIISSLKFTLNRMSRFSFSNLVFEINEINFDEEEINEEKLMTCDLGELEDFGLKMMIGTKDHMAQIFYSQDNEKYKAIEVDLNYFIHLINLCDSLTKNMN